MDTTPSEEISTRPQPSRDEGTLSEVNIHIITHDEMLECNFWVGIYVKGQTSASDLLKGEKYHQIMTAAASDGIDSDEPVLLTNTENGQPKYIYMLPPPEANNISNRNWIEGLAKTVKDWDKKELGIFLDSPKFSPTTLANLLKELSGELIKTTNITNLYMTPPSEGENAVLNAALEVKNNYSDEQNNVHIFH